MREQLDAVVRHGVVRRGEHHTQIGVGLPDQVRHRRGREDADPDHMSPGTGQPRDDGGFQHLAAGPGVTPHDGERRVAAVRLDQHTRGRDRDRECQFRGEQIAVREAANAVRAEESPHGGFLSPVNTTSSLHQRSAGHEYRNG
jgi:hypothetical protein